MMEEELGEICTHWFSRRFLGMEFSGVLRLVNDEFLHFRFVGKTRLERIGKQLVLTDVDYRRDEYSVFVRGNLIVHMIQRGLKWWFGE